MKIEKLDVRLVPVVSPASHKTNSFYVLAGSPSWARDVGHGFPEKEANTKLAMATARTLAGLGALHPAGAERLIVPVSSRALVGGENVATVLTPLRDMDEELRHKIIVEIHDFPARLTLDTLEDITIPLLTFVGGFVARPPAGLSDATVFANCNYIALTMNLAGSSDLKPLQRLWAIAAPSRLKMFLWNTPDELLHDAQRLEVFGCSHPI